MTAKKNIDPQSNEAQALVPEAVKRVYLAPQPKIKEQEIKIWDLLLPTLEYKWQVLGVVFLGLLTGILACWIYGESVYQDYIEYQYEPPPAYVAQPVDVNLEKQLKSRPIIKDLKVLQIKYPEAYYPDQYLLRPEELWRAKEILEKNFHLPKAASAFKLAQTFKGSDRIRFSDCKGCLVGSQLRVSTNQVQTTFEALTELNQFIQTRNQEIYTQLYQSQLDEENRQMLAADQSLLKGLERLDDYAFVPLSRGGRYYLEKEGVQYLLEVEEGKAKAVQFDSVAALGSLSSEIKSKLAPLTGQKTGQAARLVNLYQHYFELAQEQRETLVKRENQWAELKKAQTTAGEVSDLETSLAQTEAKQDRLVAEMNQLEFKAGLLYERLQQVMSARLQLSTYPKNRWVEVDIVKNKLPTESESQARRPNERRPDQIVDLEYYHESQGYRRQNLASLAELVATYRLGLFSPIQVVKAPSLNTVQVAFRLNFKKDQEGDLAKSLRFEDFEPVYFSTKALVLFGIIAFGLAVVSVLLRVYLLEAQQKGHLSQLKSQLINALKNWRF